MLKTDGKVTRALVHLLAVAMLALTFGAAVIAQGRGFTLPQQGFESTGQNPANYTPQERAAVEVVRKWIETTANHDLAGHMALIDDNVVFRPDPTSALRRGARAYCGAYGFVRSMTSVIKMDELYVVGGPAETLVLLKRTDINSPAGGREGGLNGYQVSLHVFARVRNGKITEWYDAPLNKVSGAAMRAAGVFPGGLPGQPAQPGQPAPPAPPANVPAVCMPYPVGSGAQAQAATPAPTPAQATAPVQPQIPLYGTSKPEFWFNPFEASAAVAVRGWFAAWKAGDPLLLGAFVDRRVIFRENSAADLGQGRDDLLRQVCGYLGGRLDLTGLYVIGGDFDTGVIARWDAYDAAGTRARMGSFFRVQNGLIVEMMNAAVDGASPATRTTPNAAACRAVNARLAPPAP